MSGTANTGIYLSGSVYAAGSEQRNLVEQNTVSRAGGDGIYLQSVNTSSTAQKNTVKSVAGSGIRVMQERTIMFLVISVYPTKIMA